MSPSTPTSQRAAPALIIGLVLLVYWNAFAGSFQFDDFNVIVNNPAVSSLNAWWHSMPGIRPLLKLSYALNLAYWPGDILAGLHAVNLALHSGNALLLYSLARRLSNDTTRAGWIALLASLLFALHPVHTEAVTMISGRSMSLMAFCYLLSLLAHLEGRRALALFAFAAALAVRETAITLPLALVLLERLRTPEMPLPQVLRVTRNYWLLAALAAVLLLMLPWFRHLAMTSLAARGIGENLISQSAAVLYLLRQAIWPFALDADALLPAFQHWQAFWVLSGMLLLTLFSSALWFWRRSGLAHWAGFGLLWFLLHLAPTNSLLPRLDLANERHLYLADIGLCLLVARGLVLSRLTARTRTGIALALLLGMGLLTQARNTVYRDEVTFWLDVTSKNPANPRAHNNLGYALANAGQPAAALDAYDQALALLPNDVTARLNRHALCRSLTACAEATH